MGISSNFRWIQIEDAYYYKVYGDVVKMMGSL